LAHLYLIIIF